MPLRLLHQQPGSHPLAAATRLQTCATLAARGLSGIFAGVLLKLTPPPAKRSA